MLTFQERVLCGNPLQRFGSGLEPDQEPTREFGPVANTNDSVSSLPPRPVHRSLCLSICRMSLTSLVDRYASVT